MPAAHDIEWFIKEDAMKTLTIAVGVAALFLAGGSFAADQAPAEGAEQEVQAEIASFEAERRRLPSMRERPRPLYEIWSTVLWGGDEAPADAEGHGDSGSSQ
jgi:hypothetical protein